jgi:hypothetical protein
MASVGLDQYHSMLTPNSIGCSVFDQSIPGTGPPRFGVSTGIDYTTYNSSFNLSLKSKSDFNLYLKEMLKLHFQDFNKHVKVFMQLKRTVVN